MSFIHEDYTPPDTSSETSSNFYGFDQNELMDLEQLQNDFEEQNLFPRLPYLYLLQVKRMRDNPFKSYGDLKAGARAVTRRAKLLKKLAIRFKRTGKYCCDAVLCDHKDSKTLKDITNPGVKVTTNDIITFLRNNKTFTRHLV
jgi:hypothetical protein